MKPTLKVTTDEEKRPEEQLWWVNVAKKIRA